MLYHSHMQAHKKCSECNFTGLNKVLAKHFKEIHSEAVEVVEAAAPNMQDADEIKRWVDARKKRYPGPAAAPEDEVASEQEPVITFSRVYN